MSEPRHATISSRLARLRKELADLELDALIVPRFDAHQGEYVAPHDERLGFVTGFTGSAGAAIVTADTARLFVDGRYTVQAQNQCPPDLVERDHLFENPPESWLANVASDAWSIGYDAMLLPPSWVSRFEKALEPVGAELKPLSHNPVDSIWADQPEEPFGWISAFPVQFAGRSIEEKRKFLLEVLQEEGADFIVETQPDNIAWLLNVRGDDVAYNPMPQSFLMLDRKGSGHWFVDRAKFEDGLSDTLPNWLSIHPKSAFLETLEGAFEGSARVLLDPDFSPAAVSQLVTRMHGAPVHKPSPVTRAKAAKNATELEGLRACHLEDAVAWAEFGSWLQSTVPARAASGEPVSEYEAEQKILEYRKARAGFLSESFRTISCSGSNAAMCHYAADPVASASIQPTAPFLLDSGGQYETGTTDATRSYCFGSLPDGYTEAYTAVFKALVALATLRFPKGTQGHHIDAICRRPLWDLGLDYDHGTGHGIGHRLSVHEQPQRIGKPYNPVDLAPGMVLSIEPGFYKAGHFGIRLENLFEIREEQDGFLSFGNLTLIPIQTDALVLDRLSETEIGWLDDYHATVLDLTAHKCSEEARKWLSSACAPLVRSRSGLQRVV
ncbi:MAG: aminopeptidase P family protein [Roseibium sp.]|uniref:aminopeptidase P family protein n=1 Tax=Roseibium sp. TaxID=1936156 RepID=UPI001B054438|nr:aminopeptidase P family protein [Roseibium sp.]MBO6895105.1 aminopeptidase P family protein [Roseibium sp.]MBO6932145.1 aminopeptidase P family protein [Roseibium sp.]